MRQTEITDQLQRRAQKLLGERRLVVDYYRIRRRLAFPWPLPAMPALKFKARTFDNYVWHTWLSWRIEERLNTLAWAADLAGDDSSRQRASNEILSVARWPDHTSGSPLDLCFSHL